MSFLLLAALATTLAAQEPGAPREGAGREATAAERFHSRLFAIDLPARWRPLAPDEAVELRPQLPRDMREVLPGRITVLGDVERWLGRGYDGEALVVVEQRFERPIDAANLEDIRRHWGSYVSTSGDRREVLDGKLTELGPLAHPAIELDLRTHHGDGSRDIRALEIYTSTGGSELIFSFRSWEDDFARARPSFRAMADSLTFPRPPKTPEELSDRLVYAAIVGGLVGLVLLVVLKARRA